MIYGFSNYSRVRALSCELAIHVDSVADYMSHATLRILIVKEAELFYLGSSLGLREYHIPKMVGPD